MRHTHQESWLQLKKWGCLAILWCVQLAAWSSPLSSLDKADSLRRDGRMVQAMSIYRNVLAEPISGCQLARTHLGIAGIQWNAGNISEAQAHLDEAMHGCPTCPSFIRTELSLELAQILVGCGQTSQALKVLEKERQLGASPGLVQQVDLATVELHFAEGNWRAVWDMTTTLDGPRAGGLRLHAGAMMGHPLSHLPVDLYLRSAKPSQRSLVMSELTHLHTSLTANRRTAEALQLARKMTRLADPIADSELWTVCQLRVAVSAERAGEPLEALLAFHEAGRAAAEVKDDALRARIAREQSRFEFDRGATASALTHLQLADSLTLGMLHSMHRDKDTKSFQSFPILNEDPFEIAASEALRKTTSPGAWPFACALAVLGLLAAALRAQELKKSLRNERLRALRMQRMAQSDSAFLDSPEPALSSLSVDAQGAVEEVLTRPDRLDFDDIIASLEMDHGTAVEWEYDGKMDSNDAPEGLLSLLSVTVRRLVAGKGKTPPFTGRIRNDWHGVHVEIEGPETPTTQELQQMFAGGTHSSTWNPVLIQIEKLAGRFTVEKRPSGELALTFLLPHPKN